MNNVKRNTNIKNVDSIFVILIFTLMSFGLVMLFSASFAEAFYKHGKSLHFISRQAVRAAIGVAGMCIISRIHYSFYKKAAKAMFFFTLILLIAVLFTKGDKNGIKRWIDFPVIGQFQPSEGVKFAIIALFSKMITDVGQSKMQTFRYGILRFVLILALIVGLMRMQPHLSGIVLICSIAGILMFMGGTDVRWFIALFILAGVGLIVTLAFSGSYMGGRAYYWLHPFSDPLNKTMQTDQSLLAIGSGGIFGLGLGLSRQKFMYLPEVQNDFIFSIVCEELGAIGGIFVIILFLLFCYKGFEIASKAPDKFSCLMCAGIIGQFGVQAMFNIAVVTATVPNTGISLPFFSYGGTALVIQLWEMGIVLNISRYAGTQKLIRLNKTNKLQRTHIAQT